MPLCTLICCVYHAIMYSNMQKLNKAALKEMLFLALSVSMVALFTVILIIGIGILTWNWNLYN